MTAIIEAAETKPTLFDSIASPLLDAILCQAPIGITIASAPHVEILRVSDFGSQLLGRSREKLEHIAAHQHVEAYKVYDPATHELATADQLPLTRATIAGETIQGEEWLVGTEDGYLVPILCNAGPIRDATGTIVGGMIAWADMSRQKALEDELRAAIAERDAARMELNHRVKNHLNLVAAMVRLEARGRGDAAEEAARAISGKIAALGNAYSVLERQPEHAAPAADLLHAVAAPLATSAVRIEVSADSDLVIPVDQCAPIAIIVNEAICNALKHGYPAGRSGRITASMTVSEGALELVVANDGCPLPIDTCKKGRGSTFINTLVSQLKGKVSLQNTDPVGVAMTIRIKRTVPVSTTVSS